MKINQLAKNLMCAGAISALTVFPSFANEETDTTGNLTVGNINIEFSTQEDLKEIVYPGELIEKKLTINNNGNKTWIRLKFTLDNENVEIPDNIRIEDENWIKIGDYYYLSEAFDKEDSVSVEYLLNVPKNLTNQDSLKQFRVISHVEAIQESNFTPDFSAEDPWYGADIVESETSETPETGTIANEFTVTYIGGAEGFINSETSFFDLFTDLMPGDEIIKELTIENINDRKVYFTLNPVFAADDELMDNVFIYFYLDGEEIGGGSLAEISGKEIT